MSDFEPFDWRLVEPAFCLVCSITRRQYKVPPSEADWKKFDESVIILNAAIRLCINQMTPPRDDRPDLYQDAWYRLQKHFASNASCTNVRCFINQLAKCAIADEFRPRNTIKRGKDVQIVSLDTLDNSQVDQIGCDVLSLRSEFGEAELRFQVDQLLAQGQISPREKTCFLSSYEEMSIDLIAERVHGSKDMVRRDIRKVQTLLRERYS